MKKILKIIVVSLVSISISFPLLFTNTNANFTGSINEYTIPGSPICVDDFGRESFADAFNIADRNNIKSINTTIADEVFYDSNENPILNPDRSPELFAVNKVFEVGTDSVIEFKRLFNQSDLDMIPRNTRFSAYIKAYNPDGSVFTDRGGPIHFSIRDCNTNGQPEDITLSEFDIEVCLDTFNRESFDLAFNVPSNLNIESISTSLHDTYFYDPNGNPILNPDRTPEGFLAVNEVFKIETDRHLEFQRNYSQSKLDLIPRNVKFSAYIKYSYDGTRIGDFEGPINFVLKNSCGGGGPGPTDPSPKPDNLRMRPNLSFDLETTQDYNANLTGDHVEFLFDLENQDLIDGTYYLYGSEETFSANNSLYSTNEAIASCTADPTATPSNTNKITANGQTFCYLRDGNYTPSTGSLIIDYRVFSQYKYFKMKFQKNPAFSFTLSDFSDNEVFINKSGRFGTKTELTQTSTGTLVDITWYENNNDQFPIYPLDINSSERNSTTTNPLKSIYNLFQIGIFNIYEAFDQNSEELAQTNGNRGNYINNSNNRPKEAKNTDVIDVKSPSNAPLDSLEESNLPRKLLAEKVVNDVGYNYYKMFIYGVKPTQNNDGYSDVDYLESRTITIRKDENTDPTVVFGDIWDCRPEFGDGFVNERDAREVLRHIIETTCNNLTSTGSTISTIQNRTPKFDTNDYTSGKYFNQSGPENGYNYVLDSRLSNILRRANTSQGTKSNYDESNTTEDESTRESINLHDALRILQYNRDILEYIPVRTD